MKPTGDHPLLFDLPATPVVGGKGGGKIAAVRGRGNQINSATATATGAATAGACGVIAVGEWVPVHTALQRIRKRLGTGAMTRRSFYRLVARGEVTGYKPMAREGTSGNAMLKISGTSLDRWIGRKEVEARIR